MRGPIVTGRRLAKIEYPESACPVPTLSRKQTKSSSDIVGDNAVLPSSSPLFFGKRASVLFS